MPRDVLRGGGVGASTDICLLSREASIDSCATRNSSWRSSGLYSGCGSGAVREEVIAIELSGDWDITFPPSGKDEGTTAALHDLPIDLGPESGEIVARRHQ